MKENFKGRKIHFGSFSYESSKAPPLKFPEPLKIQLRTRELGFTHQLMGAHFVSNHNSNHIKSIIIWTKAALDFGGKCPNYSPNNASKED